MNLLGKILVIFILVMSISFLTLAVMVGASQRAWKEQAMKNRDDALQYQKFLQEAKAESTTLAAQIESEKVARQQQIQQ
ncbi:MAG: hypothetical protein ABL888_13885, partial [Pirellulaceae bacterium]